MSRKNDMNDLRITFCNAEGEENKKLFKLIEGSEFCESINKVEYDSDGFLETIRSFEPDVILMSTSFITSMYKERYQGLNIRFPVIFFATDEAYIKDALEFNCIDYLVEPITMQDLEKAFQKLESMMFTFQNISEEYLSSIKQIVQRKEQSVKQSELKNIITRDLNVGKFLQRIALRNGDSLKIINTSDIYWVKSSGNYVEIKCGSEIFLVRSTLKGIFDSLDPNLFFRIHRSSVINIKYVDFFKDLGLGDYQVFLKNGDKLRMSRNYNSFLKEL